MPAADLRKEPTSPGADLLTGIPEEFAERRRRDREAFGVMVREAGIRAMNMA